MSVTFPAIAANDGTRERITFPAEVDGKRVQCSISYEALQDNFHGNGMDPLDCFHANRQHIVAKAADLIARGRIEQDGSIFIRSADGG